MSTVQRAGQPESWHFGAAAVVAPGGRLLFRLGNPGTATFLRSSAKPFQAVPLVEAGGEERFALDDADLALIAASHSGRPEHVERARSLLERGGFGPGDLSCGAHRPLDAAWADTLLRRGEDPTPLHNNCSGKHAGMLLACRLLGLPAAGYTEPDHPLQVRILEVVSRFSGVPAAEIGIGIDGCSVPCFRMPLTAAATAYAALAAPELAGLPPAIAAAGGRILAAMAAAPAMVAGPGRFTTRIAEVTGGRVVGKEGAEGFYAMAVRGPVAMGVALKVADGSDRARDGVAMELLRQIGSLSRDEFAALEDRYRPERRNHRDLLVGRIVPDFELEEM